MNLYYNTTAQCRVDEFNTRIAAKPVLHYGAVPTWDLHFFSGDPGETPEAVDLSYITAWRAAVDSDWNSSTEPMCRTLAADIDSSEAENGIISVPVDANTQRYLTVVNGKQSVNGWFELRGFDNQGNVALVVLLSITCNNSIDPAGGVAPGPVEGDAATMTWVRAVIAQPLIFEYSADGENWHSTMASTDTVQRAKLGSSGLWSDPFPIVKGADGATWYSGSAAPSSGSGNDGDWYIDTSSGYVYNKVSGSWVQKLNVIGPAGAGVNPRGDWVNNISYVAADMVTYQGSAYIAERSNTGVTPGTSSADWTLYISKGADGTNGTDGVTPHIGNNGNWYIGSTDTEVHAQGPAGQNGTNGTNGTDGITPTINSTNKHWMIGSTDTGVIAEATFTNSYVDVTSVNSSNQTTFTGINIIPVGIKAPSGKFYALEKESLTVNTSTSTSTLTFDAYLAYENAASFSGTWRVYFSGGTPGESYTQRKTTISDVGTIILDYDDYDRWVLTGTGAVTLSLANWSNGDRGEVVIDTTKQTFSIPATWVVPDSVWDAWVTSPGTYCMEIRQEGGTVYAHAAVPFPDIISSSEIPANLTTRLQTAENDISSLQGRMTAAETKLNRIDEADWTTLEWAASITLSGATGARQKLTMTGNTALTAPTLSSTYTELTLQIAKTSSYSFTIDGVTVTASETMLLSWYWDGATTRRLPNLYLGD